MFRRLTRRPGPRSTSQDKAAIKTVQAHGSGPQVIAPDGTKAHSGLRCMVVTEDDATLVTGGADGIVLKWNVADGSLSEDNKLGECVCHPCHPHEPSITRAQPP